MNILCRLSLRVTSSNYALLVNGIYEVLYIIIFACF